MSKDRIEQRRLMHNGREYHFVAYEAQEARSSRGQPAQEAGWFLMLSGKRWPVMPTVRGTEAAETDRQLMAWLEERMS